MLGHLHGQLLNVADLSRSMDMAVQSVNKYLLRKQRTCTEALTQVLPGKDMQSNKSAVQGAKHWSIIFIEHIMALKLIF